MSNPDKLRSALINAHKAGDVEAARKLANALKQMQSAEQGGGQAEMRSRDVTFGDRVFDAADAIGLPAQRMRRDAGALGAAIDSVGQAMTFKFSDEIEAGLKTGFGFMGDYSDELAKVRKRMGQNQEAAPGVSTAAGLAGGVATGAGLMKSGVSLIPRFANAGLKARIGAGAVEGGLYGAGYGAGAAEGGAADRALGAAQGTAIGSVIGGSIPVAGVGLRAIGRTAYESIAPRAGAIFTPVKEASRRVGDAFRRDALMRQPMLSSADEAAGFVPGQDIRNFDRGGETVRALTRSVANQSPESRGAIARAVDDRFIGQTQRLRYSIERAVGGRTDDLAFQDALLSKASQQNRSAYDAAFARNFGGAPPMVFDELVNRVPASAMANAMRVAKAEGRPFGQHLIASIDEAADTVTFKRMPSLREWHYIQRGLRSSADSAYRSGAGEVGTAYKQLHREILDAMDSANPAYQEARRGAAAFFGAEDALDAGRKFVFLNRNIRQASRAFGKMKPAEKEAFKVGFAGELLEKIGQTSDRRNVINQIFTVPNARQKIEMVMGPKAARELEAFARVENAADLMRGALGNSTTARQLVEMGLGAGAGVSAGATTVGALTTATLSAALRVFGVEAEEEVLRRVSKILLSQNRGELAEAAKYIVKSQKTRATLERAMDAIETIGRIGGAQQAATPQIAN